MDIRTWFKPKSAESKKRKIEDDDDDDVIPESPDVQIKNKKKKSNEQNSKSKNKSEKPALTAVTVTSTLFGGPIKRTEPIVKKEKKTETGIHSDEEFEKSLLEIDDVDAFQSKPSEKDRKSKQFDKKINNDRSKSPKHNNHNEKPKEMENKLKTERNKDKSPSKSKSEKSLSTSKESSSKKKVDEISFKEIQSSSKKKVDEIKKEIKESGKRKFSEFIDNHDDHEHTEIKTNGDVKSENRDANESILEDLNSSKIKKRKINKSLNESGLTDEERHERKMHSAALYQKYLNRSGPKHLGAKEMPEGAPNCLKDCAFLLTGVLDSFEREEIVETIQKYGGCIKSGISKKVTHVLAGDDAGPAKMAKAQELGIKILNEEQFLKIIKDSISKKENSHKMEIDTKKVETEIKKERKSKDTQKLEVRARSHTKSKSPPKVKIEKDHHPSKKEKTDKIHGSENKSKSSTTDKVIESMSNDKTFEQTSAANQLDTRVSTMMWVEKYKPQNVKQIIGQLGEASNVKKLTNWLTKWYINRKAKLPKPSPWSKTDDGGFYKAALLSGPPGVGKTTTVSLVCKELGFDMVEFNASDTRNKTLIREQIGELLTSTSLSGYAKGETGKQAVSKKHVLVMDEVDGMAGNEDRGGLQELIGLIKSASVPIICMCNDRNSQKMRSLVNYCYDLRFSRPRVDQIKAAMRSICCKENIKIPPDALSQLIVSAGQDVRQTLNLLSMWAVQPELLDPDRLTKDAQQAKKDVKLGPWDAIRKVFSAEDHKTMSINDKSDLFFYDYSLAPLFVQENYLQVVPHCPKGEMLDRISRAADSIAFGDVIDKRIRSAQAWSLLPMQAMYSSVLPGHYLSGHVGAQIQFPGWLGKNSRANKMHRLCQEIHAHTRLSTTGSKSSIFLDYSSHLRDAILTPLMTNKGDGVDQSLAVLESYHLLREDLDSLTELSLWPGQRNPTVLIDSKVKAAMTRTYNKKATALPYAPPAVKRGRARADDEMDDEDYVDDEPDSDPENDALIKKKKTKQPENSSDKPSTSKGKSSKSSSSSKGKSSSKKK